MLYTIKSYKDFTKAIIYKKNSNYWLVQLKINTEILGEGKKAIGKATI